MEVEADVVDGGEARAVVLAESAAAAAVDLAEVADREDRRRALGGASRRGGSICARGGRSWRAGGGCRGALEDGVDGAHLDDPAVAHDRDLVGDLGDDAHVVGDEQHRHVVRDLQALDEIEDRGLGRDVERGRRLVGDQDVGLQARAMAMQTRWRMPPEYSKE